MQTSASPACRSACSRAPESPTCSACVSGRVEHRARDGFQQALAQLAGADPRQRVQARGPAGLQAQDDAAHRLGQRAVLALRVDVLEDAAEDALAERVCLRQRALAPAQLPDHDHVGVGEQPGGVEHPRVVDERAAVLVAADVDAACAQAGLGDGRVGRLNVRARGLVTAPVRVASQPHQVRRRWLRTLPRPRASPRRSCRSPFSADHRSPRHSGSAP
jgi:hypothetical protein